MINREQLEEITAAKKQIVEGSMVIWRTRLGTLIDTGNVKGASDFLATPVEPEEANNCNCTNAVAGCGQPILVSGTVTPGEPKIE